LLEELLEKLSADGLQSDARFTRSLVQCCVDKGQGPVKIDHQLKQSGIEQDLIDSCLESATIDWLAVAEEARQKKYGKGAPKDDQNKAKQSRFLYGRGFSGDQIDQLLKA